MQSSNPLTANVTALLQFAFQLGGAISLCISQALFFSKLTSELRAHLPGPITAGSIDLGSSNVPGLTSPSEFSYELQAIYQIALHKVFVFLLVASGLAFLASFGFEHKNVRRVEQERNDSKMTQCKT